MKGGRAVIKPVHNYTAQVFSPPRPPLNIRPVHQGRQMRTQSISGSAAPPLVFVRPSRSGDAAHKVFVDPVSLRPMRCTCLAGRHDIVCWAALQVAADELLPIARQRWAQARGVTDAEHAAAVYAQVVRRRGAAARVL